MSPQIVLDLLQEAFKISLMLSLPVMLSTLVVGVAVSIVQSITSIQEQTMVFVPKMIAVFIALLVCFSWMMNTILGFTTDLFNSIPSLLK
jgi:flagellar biosynthetic protein FliQ